MSERSKLPDLFTPLFEVAIEKYGIIGAAVFGEVWRYCQMQRQQCDAAAETIACTLHVSLRTVQRWLKVLSGSDRPYIRDLTPGRRNKPHVYVATSEVWRAAENKTAVPVSFTATADPAPTVTESHSAMTESHSAMTESHSAMTESRSGYDLESYEETYKRLPQERNQETAADALPARTGTVITDPPTLNPTPTLTQQEIDVYLAAPDPALMERWSEIMAEVRGQVTRGTYDQMISALKPLTIRDGTAVLYHPTGPGADWCRVKLKKIMPRTVGSILHAPVDVCFLAGGP